MNESTAQSRADTEPSRYLSYLLRMWCAEDCKPAPWRASLEDPHSGERLGFASPEELFTFLIEQVEGKAWRESGQPEQDGGEK